MEFGREEISREDQKEMVRIYLTILEARTECFCLFA